MGQYSVNMLLTPHSRRYSPKGSFLTTARALQTMDTLMHNFKGGPNLVKEGEPEYDTLKQDSILHGNITAALRKLPHTPFMQSLDMEKESITPSFKYPHLPNPSHTLHLIPGHPVSLILARYDHITPLT